MERKGICKNVGACALANKVQIITDDAEFICQECGEELRECKEDKPVKKKKSKLPMLVGGAVIAIAVIVSCIIMLTRKPEEPGQAVFAVEDSLETASAKQVVENIVSGTVAIAESALELAQAATSSIVYDTVVIRDTVVVEKSATAPKQNHTNGSLRLSYGTYIGDIKNGYPHGQGRLTYSNARQINRNDVKGRMANAGDYVIGEFFNGFVVYGKLYNSRGELKGSLNFGVGPENSYDSK